MIYIAIILGIVIGAIITFAIVATWVARSNRMGDSKGTFQNFSKSPMRILQSRDANRPDKLSRGGL